MIGYCVFVALFVVGAIMLIKNEITYRNHIIISRSILKYKLDMLHNDKSSDDVDWADEEDYGQTLFRLWDWGYTRILPPEKYEIVKPYIEQAIMELKKEKKERNHG